MTTPESTMAQRVATVRERVARATESAGRSTPPRIIAVTKTHGPDQVDDLRGHGLVDFGENRVHELVDKRYVAGRDGDQWHLVGPLQRSNVNDVVGSGTLVHTADRRSLIDRMQRHCEAHGLHQRVLVQVNVADDPAKRGCRLDEAADLVAYIANAADVTVEGLMTMAPFPDPDDDANALARPHFEALRRLRDGLLTDHPQCRELSMGMSGDLEAAIAEGATLVRIGTALLGPRGERPWERLGDPTTTTTTFNKV